MNRITLLILAISLIVGCGKNPPAPIMAEGNPTSVPSLIGQSYNLTYVQGSPQWPLHKVALNEMTLTITNATKISGTFVCYVNNVASGTATYSAPVTWSTSTVTIGAITTNPPTCQPDHYFTFQSTMYYGFMGPELQLSDTNQNVIASFVSASIAQP